MLYPTDEFGAAGGRQLPAHVADEPPQNWIFVAREIESHYEPAKNQQSGERAVPYALCRPIFWLAH
jgi:hypothetical protein